jgi:hypothetical protein
MPFFTPNAGRLATISSITQPLHADSWVQLLPFRVDGRSTALTP